MSTPTDEANARRWQRILGPLLVEREGFGGATLRFHPSHDMGALYCRACGAWGQDNRAARRPCRSRSRFEAVGL